MSPLEAAGLLELWERAEVLPPVQRAVALAAAWDQCADEATVRALPLGLRDERVLRLRSTWEGRTLDATAVCPACAERVEIALEVEALLEAQAGAPPPVPLERDGERVVWRCPDSDDLAAAVEAPNAAVAERVLLERCTDLDVSGGAAGPHVRAALAEAMAAADPLADVLVDVACSACGGAFTAELDVTEIVWAELTSHARRLLSEVGVLARAYGWTEDDVLALGSRRRGAYLQLAEGLVR